MTPTRLLMIDTADIQDYVFGSNNLQQNVGASELVTQATRKWIFETLSDLKLAHNGKETKDWLDYAILDKDKVAHELDVEVIYAGGGNAALLFAKEEDCRKFVRQWTRKIFAEARRLQPVIHSTPIDWATDLLKSKIEKVHQELLRGQVNLTPPALLLGLGVTAACVFTGLPATKVESNQLISTVVKHKLKAKNEAEDRLHQVLLKNPKLGGRLHEKKIELEFVQNFDDFGARDEFSYIAVIHIDGNRMGERREKYLDSFKFNNASQNDECVIALRRFSQRIHETSAEALQRTVIQLLKYSHRDPEDDDKLKFGPKKHKQVIAPQNQDRVECLPFRPIVFGGDDVTFVCDGRLGLSLAAIYLQELAQLKLADGNPAFARAGVAIMKSHFPFSRAYELADELCASAKKRIEELKHEYDLEDALAMDWHFSTTGIVSGLTPIRRREYYSPQNGELYIRPLAVTVGGDNKNALATEWRTWSIFKEMVHYFRDGKEWKNRRNKVKALREALRNGPEAVKLFLLNYAKDTKEAGLYTNEKIPPLAETTGWSENRCVYFDAIEIMDFFVSVEDGEAS